jgi:hypothetical protein
MNLPLCENKDTVRRATVHLYSLPAGELKNRGSTRRHPNGDYTWRIYAKSLHDIFETRVDEWLEETQWQSSINFITRHRQFGELLEMGPQIIPFVLQRIASGDVHVHWFPLLKDLAAGEDPVPPHRRGYIQQMADEWLAWGRRNQLISSDK